MSISVVNAQEIDNSINDLSLSEDNNNDLVSSSLTNDDSYGSDSADIYVNSSYVGESDGSVEKPYASIVSAVGNATEGQTVHIFNGQYDGEGTITVAKSINIAGESQSGVILNGTVFKYTTDYTGILANLTINGPFSSVSSPSIDIAAKTISLNIINVTINDWVIEGSSSVIKSQSKGAIVFDNLRIFNSRITALSTYSTKASVLFLAQSTGGVTVKNSVINNTRFLGNAQSNGVIKSQASAVNIDNVTIGNNTGISTGLIHAESAKAILIINNSKILDNNITATSISATSKVGILFYAAVSNDNITVEKSIIRNNTASNHLCYIGHKDASITLNYNIMTSNTFNRLAYVTGTGKLNLDYNWWGNNTNPDSSKINNVVVMDTYANPSEIYSGENTTITADFTKYNESRTLYALSKNIPDEITVNFNDETYQKISKGIASITVSPTESIDFNISADSEKQNVSVSVLEEPIIAEIMVKSEYTSIPSIYAGVNNTITVTVKNTGRSANNVTVKLLIGDELIGSKTLADYESGETYTLTFIDTTIRPIGENTVIGNNNEYINYSVAVNDVEDALINETNSSFVVLYNGNLGKDYEYPNADPLLREYNITGDVIVAGGSQYAAKEVNVSDVITVDYAGDVSEALLYVSYNWNNPSLGDFNTWTIAFNNKTIAPIASYIDQSNLGKYAKYAYGLVVYNVTDLVVNGENTLSINKTYGSVAIYPASLLVLTNEDDTSNVAKTVYILEEVDLLSKTYNKNLPTGFNTTFNAVDGNATLYVFAAGAGNGEGNLIINGENRSNVWSGTDKSFDSYISDVDAGNISVYFESTGGTILALHQMVVVENPRIAPEGTYSGLAKEIGTGGNINLIHSYYRYDSGDTIVIKKSGVIDGNGAVIDMAGAPIMRIFTVNRGGVTFKNITFINAQSSFGGAVLFKNGGSLFDCNFINNTASSSGGAVYFDYYSEDCIVSGCTFVNNTAGELGGGAICFEEFSEGCIVSDCNFTGNNVSSYGGAVCFLGSGSVSGGNFEDNHAIEWGGAVYFDQCSYDGIVSNCNFINNSAGEEGGAIYMYTGNVEYCNFTRNSAPFGGAIRFDDKGSVTNCNFNDNKAYTNTTGSDWGGAIYMYSGDIEKCNFTNNTARYGGAIDFDNTGTITNCNFNKNNVNRFGGAVFFNEDGTVTNCNFTGNNATYGGATYFNNTGNVNNCNFTYNGASKGSAIYICSNFDGSIENSTFLNNKADSDSLTLNETDNVVYIYFTGNDNYLNAIYSDIDIEFINVTYWGADGIMNTDAGAFNRSNNEAGQNITIIINNTGIIEEIVKTTDANGIISLEFEEARTTIKLTAQHKEDDYYSAIANEIEFKLKFLSSLNLTANEFIIQANVTPGATGNVTFTVRKNNSTVKEECVDLNNSIATIDLFGLPAGEYNITAHYNGDEMYISSDASIIHETPKVDPVIDIQTGNITYGELEIINVTVNGRTDYTLTVWIYEKNYTVTDGTLTLEGLAGGIYQVTAVFDGDGVYNNASKNSSFEIAKFAPNLRVVDNVTVIMEGQTARFTIVGPDDMASNLDIDGMIVFFDGEYTYSLSGLDIGIYYVNVSYLETPKYLAENLTQCIVVNPKADVPITVDNISIFVDDTAVVIANVPVALNGQNLTITVNGTSMNATVKNGNATASFTGLAYGEYEITVDYAGDTHNYANSTTATLTVNKVPTKISLENESFDLFIGNEVSTGATLTPADAGNLTYISSNESVAKVENGQIIAISKGNATIEISFGGNSKYAQAENKTLSVSVALRNASITVDPTSLELIIGENGEIFVTTDPELLDCIFTSSDESVVTVQNKHGVGSVAAVGEGNATITVTINEEAFVKNSTVVTVTVKKAPKENATISIDAPEITEGENATVTVTLPEDATGTVTASVDGKNFTADVINGTAAITLPELGAGNYTIPVTYSGDDKYNQIETEANINVKEGTSDIISAPDVTKYYGGSERFVVSVTDYQGTPLANKSVTIVINGVSYSRITDENGTCSIGLGLPAGVYNATATVDNKTIDSVVTIITTVNGTDLVKVFKNATQYYATFLDGEGKYLPEGTAVRFNINGVMYDRKVTQNGLAKLNINLQQGEYIITAINLETGEMASNNITVIPRITENSNLIKYYRNASQYTVKLIGEDGNPVGPGEVVTFNINGVFYNRTTNESGIAKMNINLGAGDYVITAEYKGCKVSNNITVLPVLTAKDITMKYRDGTKFTATLVDGQGKAYAGQSVQFNINGVLYNRVTGSDGVAKLNINLMPGEYIITSSYNGFNTANKITIRG